MKDKIQSKRPRRIIISSIGAIVVVGILVMLFASSVLTPASTKRSWKSIRSDLTGGLNRTVTVYDYNGNQIRQYHGKFDIEENDTRVFFDDENGKRITIYNAIVISEED